MSGQSPHGAADPPPGSETPTRDSHGRWVRRAAEEGEARPGKTAVPRFVIDDRIFEATAPVAEERPPDEEGFGRGMSRRLLLAGALLLGAALFAFQRGWFTAGPPDAVDPEPSPSVVAPVTVPTLRKQAIPRPARPAVTAAAPRPAAEPIAPVPAPAPDPAPAPTLAPAPAPTPAPAATAVEVAPSTPSAPSLPNEEDLFNLAEEYLQLGDDKSAEALYRRILDEGSQRGRAALALGDVYSRKNDFARAQQFYRASKQFFRDESRTVSPP